MNKTDLQEAVKIIQSGQSFFVAGHVNPDGDSLGCMCALALGLKSLGKSVLLVCPDDIPDSYKFLPESQNIAREVPANQTYDAAIVVDCEGLSRLGPVRDSLSLAKRIIEIDHHPGGERGGDVEIIKPSASASAELVYQVLKEAEIKITPQIAECLLTALVTDTGCFRFSNVNPDTLRIAADLVETGILINRVVRKVYETRSLTHAKTLGAALSSLTTVSNGRIAYSYITRKQMKEAAGNGAETEGIVNYVRSIRGAKVGILFREEEDGTTRVSMRSGDHLDISQVARLFGGGGHRSAAGCTLNQPLEEAIDLVLSAVQKWMAF